MNPYDLFNNYIQPCYGRGGAGPIGPSYGPDGSWTDGLGGRNWAHPSSRLSTRTECTVRCVAHGLDPMLYHSRIAQGALQQGTSGNSSEPSVRSNRPASSSGRTTVTSSTTTTAAPTVSLANAIQATAAVTYQGDANGRTFASILWTGSLRAADNKRLSTYPPGIYTLPLDFKPVLVRTDNQRPITVYIPNITFGELRARLRDGRSKAETSFVLWGSRLHRGQWERQILIEFNSNELVWSWVKKGEGSPYDNEIRAKYDSA